MSECTVGSSTQPGWVQCQPVKDKMFLDDPAQQGCYVCHGLCFWLCLFVLCFFTVAPNAAYFSLSFELSWVTFSVSLCCIVKMFFSYLKWSEGLLANYSTFIAREICSWNGQTLTIVPGWFSLYLFPVFFLGSPLVSAQSSPVGSQKEESLASFITSGLISIG